MYLFPFDTKTPPHKGISENDFNEEYFKPAKRLLGCDNVYGDIILKANDIISQQKYAISSHIKFMSGHPHTWTSNQMNKVLWNTGIPLIKISFSKAYTRGFFPS